MIVHNISKEGNTVAKSSSQQLIKDEQKILSVLQTNANESIDVIAKKCGFSRQKVWRIIKKLEKEKTIWGYTVLFDPEHYQLKRFTMLMKRTTVPIDKKILNEILTTRLDDLLPGSVIRIENIEYVHGSYDGIFTFLASDIVTAKKFCERFNARFSPYTASLELLEDILVIRKQTIRNPKIKEQIEYL
jgi:DNA-binding Lrp family transcriptional regulator